MQVLLEWARQHWDLDAFQGLKQVCLRAQRASGAGRLKVSGVGFAVPMY
ncbi:MAG: hypothetical protein ACRETS_13445 [Steroidobacteraceae bacterium]